MEALDEGCYAALPRRQILLLLLDESRAEMSSVQPDKDRA